MANAKDDLESLIHFFAKEIAEGLVHLRIGRHLTRALIGKPNVYNVARTFFSLGIHAHMVEAFLHLSRLFDTRRDALKIEYLLKRAGENAGRFRNRTPQQVRELIRQEKRQIKQLRQRAKPVNLRRDKLLAHLDPKAVANLDTFEQAARITFGEMEALYQELGQVVNNVYGAYKNEEVEFEQIIGWNDFKRLLEFAELGRQTYLRRRTTE